LITQLINIIKAQAFAQIIQAPIFIVINCMCNISKKKVKEHTENPNSKRVGKFKTIKMKLFVQKTIRLAMIFLFVATVFITPKLHF